MTSFFTSSLFGQAVEATHTTPMSTSAISSMLETETRENALLAAGPVSPPKATVEDADEETPDDTSADDPVPLIVSDILYPPQEASVAREKTPAKASEPAAHMTISESTKQEESKGESSIDNKGGEPESVEEEAQEEDKDENKGADGEVNDDANDDDSDDSDAVSSIADYRASSAPEPPVVPQPTPRASAKRKATGPAGSTTAARKRGRTAKAAATPTSGKTAKMPTGRKPGRPPGRPAAAARKSVAMPSSSQTLSGRQASLAAKKVMETSVPRRAAASAAKAALAAAVSKRTRKPASEPSKAAKDEGTKLRSAKTAVAKAAVTKAAVAKTASAKKAPAKKATKAAPAKGPTGGANDDADDTPEEYVVEAIMGTRKNAKTKEMEYHIKWTGYPKNQSTWEPRDNLTGCEALLRTFEKARRTTKK